jgi:hypothetical protein
MRLSEEMGAFDPLAAAFQSVIETKNLLDLLVTSSESFNYPQAKIALKKLQRQQQELVKLMAHFEVLRKAREPDIRIVEFARASGGQLS